MTSSASAPASAPTPHTGAPSAAPHAAAPSALSAPSTPAAPPAAPRPATARPPLRFGMTLLHLAALGTVGFTVLGGFLAAFAAGVGTAILLGIGLGILVGVIYAVWGVAWFETERVSALYRVSAAPLRFPERTAPGFRGWLRSLLAIVTGGRTWAAFGSFALAATLGTVMLSALQFSLDLVLAGGADLLGAVTLADASSSLLPAVTLAVAAAVAAGAVIGAVLLHRAATVAILTAGARASELSEQVRQSTRQKEGALRSAEVERARIERDLHDGVQPRLVSIGMTLGLARQQLTQNPDSARALIDEAHASTQHAITELRQLTRGIYASVLEDRGLDAALSAIAARSHIPVHLDVRLSGPVSRPAQTAAYFAIAEAIGNVMKHSRAEGCRVLVRLRANPTGPELWARIEDDGVGGARVAPGGGLDGMIGRVTAAGGRITLDSPVGGPTTIEMSIPCAF